MRSACLLMVALLAASPAFAQTTCQEKHQTSSCQEGYVWNAETASCVQSVSS